MPPVCARDENECKEDSSSVPAYCLEKCSSLPLLAEEELIGASRRSSKLWCATATTTTFASKETHSLEIERSPRARLLFLFIRRAARAGWETAGVTKSTLIKTAQSQWEYYSKSTT